MSGKDAHLYDRERGKRGSEIAPSKYLHRTYEHTNAQSNANGSCTCTINCINCSPPSQSLTVGPRVGEESNEGDDRYISQAGVKTCPNFRQLWARVTVHCVTKPSLCGRMESERNCNDLT